MARHISRTACFTAAVASLTLSIGCQAPGGTGYATMRFAMDRQAGAGAQAGPLVAANPPAAGAVALAGSAPLVIAADVLPTASNVSPAQPGQASGSGGGGRPRLVVPATFEVAHPAAGPGEVTIAFDLGGLGSRAAQRRLLATVADIDYVVVTITPASGAEVSQTIPAAGLAGGAGSVTFAGLPPTTATATIQAFDALGNEIGKGTQSLTIDPLVPTTVNFTVTLNPTYVPLTGTVSANATFVDGPVIAGTPPPGTVFKTGDKIAESKDVTNPEGITFDPSGTLVWFPGFTGDQAVALEKTVKLKSSFTLKIPGSSTALRPTEIAFDPAGGMWVANYGAGSVSQVDVTTGAIIRTVVTGPNPVDIEFLNGVMHVLLYPADAIVRFTTTGLPAGLPIAVGLPLPAPAKKPFHLPTMMKISPANEIWTVNLRSDTVSRLSSTGVFIKSIAVGDEPEALAFGAPDVVWVTNNRSGTVSKINMLLNIVETTFKVGARPRGVAIDKVGNLWIACSEVNQVVRMSPTGVILGRYPTGKDPRHVAVDSAGAIWVACHAGSLVQKFSP